MSGLDCYGYSISGTSSSANSELILTLMLNNYRKQIKYEYQLTKWSRKWLKQWRQLENATSRMAIRDNTYNQTIRGEGREES